MQKIGFRVLLWIILVLAGGGAVYLWEQRQALEEKNRQVEIAIEYSQVRELAQGVGKSEREVLTLLKQGGVTGVLYKEEVLADLEPNQVSVAGGSTLLLNTGLPEELRRQLKPENTYLLTFDTSLGKRLGEQLRLKTGAGEEFFLSGAGAYLVGNPFPRKNLENIGLGFNEKAIALIQEVGLDLLLQVRTWPGVTPEALTTFFQPLKNYPHLKVLLFNDEVLPGYGTAAFSSLVKEVKTLGVPIGIIEFNEQKQKGIIPLVLALEKNAVRLHSVLPQEIKATTPGELEQRFSLAVRERNIRVVLARFFFPEDKTNWLAVNLGYLSRLHHTLANQGFTFGPPQPFGSLPLSRPLVFLVGLGVIAGSIFLLDALNLRRLGFLLGFLGLTLWVTFLLNEVTWGRKGMALLAAFIFPAWGVLLFLKPRPSGLLKSIGLLLATSFISLLGAVLVTGLLADVGFMLKIDQFSGVKAAYIVPLVILVFAFWLGGKKDWYQRLLDFWNASVAVKYLVVAVLVGAVGVIYILRTGNEAAVAVSSFERQFRFFLDQFLLVRPRTKEFLIGHPFLLLTFYLGYQQRYLPLLFLGAIGQVSLLNTFCHIHTPLAVSLLRTFHGLWLGIIGGLVLILIVEGLAGIHRRLTEAEGKS